MALVHIKILAASLNGNLLRLEIRPGEVIVFDTSILLTVGDLKNEIAEEAVGPVVNITTNG